jgi:uncharacterized protein involved in outer membrane biogenesis
VGQLRLGGLQLGAASTRFELDKSVLGVDPLVAQAYGAQLEAALRIDATAAVPRITAKGSLNEVDLRGLLADMTRSPWLEGRGALTWDIAADGASVGSLRNALAGSLNLTLRGGVLLGVDLRAALLEGRADLGKRMPAQQREFNARSAPANDGGPRRARAGEPGRCQRADARAGPMATAAPGVRFRRGQRRPARAGAGGG